MAKIGSVVVSLDVDIGRMSRFTSAARMVEVDSARMRRGMAETSRSVGALRSQMSQPMRTQMFKESLRTISRTNDEMQRLQATMVGLSAITGTGLTAALSGTYLVQTADRARLLSNQLKTVTEDYSDLVNIQDRLYDIAQRTRSSLESTTRIYARTSRAAEFFALSQEKVLRVTETIQKAFAIGGATQAEALGAAIQLSQGIASDRFSGEEFRSVAENAPVLLQNMAKSLGVNIGKLREMAHAGELTGKVVTDAILRSSEAIDASFDKTAATVGQAFTRLDNAFVRYIGNVDNAYGITRRMSEGLSSLAENFDEVAQYAGLAVAAMATVFAGRAVNSSYQGVTRSIRGLIDGQVDTFRGSARDMLRARMEIAKVTKEIAEQEARVVDAGAKVAGINALGRQRNQILSTQAKEVEKLRAIEDQWAATALRHERAATLAKSATARATAADKAVLSATAEGDRMVARSIQANQDYLKSVDRLNAAKKTAAALEANHAAAMAQSAAAIARQRAIYESAEAASVVAPSAASLEKVRNEYGKIGELQAQSVRLSEAYSSAQARASALVERRAQAVVAASIAERESIAAVQKQAALITDQKQKAESLNAIRVRAVALQETLKSTSESLTKQIEAQSAVVGRLNTQLKDAAVTERERVALAQRHATEVGRLRTMTNTRSALVAEIAGAEQNLVKARAAATSFGIAMRGAQLAGSAVLAAVGGIPGILFGAAAAGMIYYVQQSEKAAEQTRSITAELEAMGYLTKEAANEMERFQQSVAEGRISAVQAKLADYREDLKKTFDEIQSLDFAGSGPDETVLSADMSTEEFDRAFVDFEKRAGEANARLKEIAAEAMNAQTMTAEMRAELQGISKANPALSGVIDDFLDLTKRVYGTKQAIEDTEKTIRQMSTATPSWLQELVNAEAAQASVRDLAKSMERIGEKDVERSKEALRRANLSIKEQEALAAYDKILEEVGDKSSQMSEYAKAELMVLAEQTAERNRQVKLLDEMAKAALKVREDVGGLITGFGAGGEFQTQNAQLLEIIEKSREAAQATTAIEEAQKQLAVFADVALTEIAGLTDEAAAGYGKVRDQIVGLAADIEAGSVSESMVIARLKDIREALLGMGVGKGIVDQIVGSFASLASQIYGATAALQNYSRVAASMSRQSYTVPSAGGGATSVSVTRGSTSANTPPQGTNAPKTYSVPGGTVTVRGYDGGGWTGAGGKYEPAGIVHKDEFVFTKEQTAAAGKENLAAFAKALEGGGYADGGLVGGTAMGSLFGATTLTEIEINTAATVDHLKRVIGYLDAIDADLMATLNELRSNRSVGGSSSSSSGGSTSGSAVNRPYAGSLTEANNQTRARYGLSTSLPVGGSGNGAFGYKPLGEARPSEIISGVRFGYETFGQHAQLMAYVDYQDGSTKKEPIQSDWSSGNEVMRKTGLRYSAEGAFPVTGNPRTATFGFSTGGMIGAGGAGAASGDSQRVSFFKNPAEAVYILTGAQQAAFKELGKALNDNSPQKGGDTNVNVNVTVNGDEISTRTARQALSNQLAIAVTRSLDRTNS